MNVAAGEIDDELHRALRKRPGKRPLELGRRVEIHLATGSDDPTHVRERPARDRELEAGR